MSLLRGEAIEYDIVNVSAFGTNIISSETINITPFYKNLFQSRKKKSSSEGFHRPS